MNDNKDIKNKFIKCECSSHMIEIEFDGDLYYFSFWELSRNNVILSYRERIRWAFKILFSGIPWVDSVVLSENKVNEMVEFLKSTKNSKKQLLND